MNINRFILLASVASITFVGCNNSAQTPPAGFRLTVQTVATDENACAALLTIQTAHAGSISVSVDEDAGHSSVSLPDANASGLRDGSVALIASRIAPGDKGDSHILTLIRSQTPNGSFAGGPSTYTLPRSTKLAEHFTITAQSGDYPLNTPIKIARLGGKPVTITVGKPTK